ncbi:subtilisin-like protease PjSBT1.7.3 [Phtheirospermum japonicum]|uniref:Subtilisin-like protease PjSBT1.7.3 n=1 Tax=Phtheirospermum japonicum TaxID=374723 RepID=A0A830D3W8_9LAMI|nr:subtilisin-like protease PjSBT1.7.3 [Phtheirospermum japonicum]
MLYIYKHVISGFSATLTSQEAQALRARDEIVSVQLETTYQLHTTRTPHFLGLEQHQDKLPGFEESSNVIIGVLDTGVWPESQSFNDSGYGPVSKTRWNGTCEEKMCNKKLVGARYFSKAYEDLNETRSPRDIDGHGTHTSSTAAGSVVPKASLLGYAEGTARGMANQTRVAVYKCCWRKGCLSSDILAAMDQAIEDKVDVLSLSLGGGPIPYFIDKIAIGAFAAMQQGILVSCSAGNSGPYPFSLANTAPWITTVGAGTLDRDFPADVILGNGERYPGVSLYSGPPLPAGKLPIVYAADASNNVTSEKVNGKIVLCDRGVNARVAKGAVVKHAGGLGMILANTDLNGDELVADAHLLPATAITAKTRRQIKKYLSSAHSPTATIEFDGTKLGVQPSPLVAAFSSRGPNPVIPQILKPDMIAPGVNILAAWPDTVGPTGLELDKRHVKFNIVSGTSMSCPHVSGLAALIKAAHPDWSPAAIRSALMTTAYSTYNNRKPSTPFDYGAGHVAPIRALHPGLVYDLCPLDYLNFLCALHYGPLQIEGLARKTNFICDKKKTYSVNDLNYPSFAVSVKADPKGGTVVVNHTRTLTNVGQLGKTYHYKVKLFSPSQSVKISVAPGHLTFNKPNDKRSYNVTFKVATNMQANTNHFGRIEWSDGKLVVGSPVAFSWT